jgi:hypothetical protein
MADDRYEMKSEPTHLYKFRDMKNLSKNGYYWYCYFSFAVWGVILLP